MLKSTAKQVNLLKVFGNYERLKLLCCLVKPHSVTELLSKCTLSQSALSQHLKVLKKANLVTCLREGKNRIYSVSDTRMLAVAKLLLEH